MSAIPYSTERSSDPPTLVLAKEPAGEPCRSCGSAVAADQRYCLDCGQRSPAGRVPFAETLAPASEAAITAAAAGAAKPAIGPGLAAAIVCLAVLFLGTGVLIGRSGSSDRGQVVAAPQTVTTVQAGGDPTSAGGEPAKPGGGAKPTAGATAGQKRAVAPPVATGARKKALEKAVNCRTTVECQEASKKIPNEFTTPGKPPPVDGKAPAGGAQGQVFQ